MDHSFFYYLLPTTWICGIILIAASQGIRFYAKWGGGELDVGLTLQPPLQEPYENFSEHPHQDEIPEGIRKLMEFSPTHPEVEEIDASDRIIGLRFEAKNYPPGMEEAGDE